MHHAVAHVAVALALVAAPACRRAPEPAAADPAASDHTGTVSPLRVLVFTRTAGYRHDAIPDGVTALRQLGAEHGLTVEVTDDPGAFTDTGLARVAAVVFLNTTGDVLDDAQQAALKGYVERGGGFVGIHAAADCEFGWPWYESLIGAWFARHPDVQPATVRATGLAHPAAVAVPEPWVRTDEWYDFQRPPAPDVTVLLTVDEASYRGGGMGAHHPIAWAHAVGQGRAFTTAMGHTRESYAEPLFRAHLLAGLRWAAGL